VLAAQIGDGNPGLRYAAVVVFADPPLNETQEII
jgi:hypothetical protein